MRAWATKASRAPPSRLTSTSTVSGRVTPSSVRSPIKSMVESSLDPRRFEAGVGEALRVEEVRSAQGIVERRRADFDRICADGESDVARRGPVEVERQPPVEDAEFALSARKADRVDDEADVRARRIDAPSGAFGRGADASIGECGGAGDSRDEPGGRGARKNRGHPVFSFSERANAVSRSTPWSRVVSCRRWRAVGLTPFLAERARFDL
jgi:hypothetical protein